MMEADKTKGPQCHYRLSEIKPNSKPEYEENKAALLATLPKIVRAGLKPAPTAPPTTKGTLGQNIPNPFTGTTTISYEIYTEGTVELQIFNAMGQLLKLLPQGTLVEGTYHTTISLAGMPVGIYHYALYVNGERVDAKKMVVK
jgi:type IV secretory pathway VirB10-like protein